MKMTNLLSCTTKAWAIDLSVQKGGFTVDDWRCECFFFSYLEWINNSDEIFVGRVISRQVEYQEVYQSQKGDQNYYRFGAFSVERREEYLYMRRRWLYPILRKTCCPDSKFLAENCVQEVFRDDLAGDWKRNCVLYAFFTHRQYIILLSFNFQSNMLSSLCGFSFCNTTIVVVLYVCRTSV